MQTLILKSIVRMKDISFKIKYLQRLANSKLSSFKLCLKSYLLFYFFFLYLGVSLALGQKVIPDSKHIIESNDLIQLANSKLDNYFKSDYYKSLPEDSVYVPNMTLLSLHDERIQHLLDEYGHPINPIKQPNLKIRSKDDNSERNKNSLFSQDISALIPHRIDFVEIQNRVYIDYMLMCKIYLNIYLKK